MTTELEKQFLKSLGLKQTNLFVEHIKHYFKKLKHQVQAIFEGERCQNL